MKTEVKDVGVEQMLHRMHVADFKNQCPSKKGEDITEMSVEDRSFMTLMEKECSKEENITNFLYHLEFLMKCSQITEAWLKQD